MLIFAWWFLSTCGRFFRARGHDIFDDARGGEIFIEPSIMPKDREWDAALLVDNFSDSNGIKWDIVHTGSH